MRRLAVSVFESDEFVGGVNGFNFSDRVDCVLG